MELEFWPSEEIGTLYLDDIQIQQILVNLVKRHKNLLKLLDSMIEEQGEDQVIFVHGS